LQKLDGRTLDLGIEAWDVWLPFDRKARWYDTAPPEPAWWKHQLRGLPKERRLDPEPITAKAAELPVQRAKP